LASLLSISAAVSGSCFLSSVKLPPSCSPHDSKLPLPLPLLLLEVPVLACP
jgi:hypothetical protein